jgi:hypothetical protein
MCHTSQPATASAVFRRITRRFSHSAPPDPEATSPRYAPLRATGHCAPACGRLPLIACGGLAAALSLGGVVWSLVRAPRPVAGLLVARSSRAVARCAASACGCCLRPLVRRAFSSRRPVPLSCACGGCGSVRRLPCALPVLPVPVSLPAAAVPECVRCVGRARRVDCRSNTRRRRVKGGASTPHFCKQKRYAPLTLPTYPGGCSSAIDNVRRALRPRMSRAYCPRSSVVTPQRSPATGRCRLCAGLTLLEASSPGKTTTNSHPRRKCSAQAIPPSAQSILSTREAHRDNATRPPFDPIQLKPALRSHLRQVLVSR